ncbi:MAG: hypothetical protein KJ927_11130, partial [Candidatus Eisenbacteria bacterium]|nr:hypothetical protein [Candidatus Eisenbacteria bacterium]
GDGEAEVHQDLIPFWLHLLPHPTFETWISSSYASSSLSKRADGDLSGLSSVRFECDWQPGPEGLHLFGGLDTPMDSPALTAEENLLATLLAEPVLRWDVPVYGKGLELRLGTIYGYALPVGAVTAGLLMTRRGAYASGFHGDFEPVSDIRFAGGFQMRTGDADLRTDLSWTTGGHVRLNNRTILTTKGRLDLSVRGESPWRRNRIYGGLGMRAYAAAESEPLPGGLLPIEAGNLWVLNLGLLRDFNTWLGRVDLDLVSSPDAPTGRNGGYSWALSLEWVRRFNATTALSLECEPTWGTLDNGGKLTGLRMGITLFFRPGGAPGTGWGG